MPKHKPKEITVKLTKPALKKGSKIDLAEAVKMRLAGRTHREIADRFKVTRSAVTQILAKWCPDVADVQAYKANESDLVAALKSRIITSITDEKLADTNAYSLTTMLAMMIDKGRLIDGKSTANVETIISNALDLADKVDDL